MVRFVAVVGVLGVGAFACFPPPLDETGLLCDDTRPCDTGYLCFDGVCGRLGEIDAGPDNWIANPSFELFNDPGPAPLDWQRAGPGQATLIADNARAHTGLRSARLSSADGGAPSLLTNPPPVLGTQDQQVWCARAFVQSNSADGGILTALFVRERDDTGTVVNENTPARPSAPVDQWLEVDERFICVGAARLDVRVAFGRASTPVDLLWVDDVQLKRSVDGTCVWP
jgi:hypothetical protein